MSAKAIVTAVLLVFVLAAVAWLVYDAVRKGDDAAAAAGPEASVAPAAEAAASEAGVEAPQVVAYYFHRTKRCPTCMKIERYTQEAIERSFAGELEAGVLAFRILNLDEPENERFLEAFELSVQAVVLSEPGEGAPRRWKDLTKVWDLVGDKAAFLAYVRQETQAFLHGE